MNTEKIKAFSYSRKLGNPLETDEYSRKHSSARKTSENLKKFTFKLASYEGHEPQ